MIPRWTFLVSCLLVALVASGCAASRPASGAAAGPGHAGVPEPPKLLSSDPGSAAPQRTVTRPPPPQEPVDYNHPPRAYDRRAIRNWTVWVEQEMVTRDPDLAEKALARLDRKLAEALAVLPRAAQTNFEPLAFFLLYGKKAAAGGRDNGLEYFTQPAPESYPHLDPRMGRSIVVYSAENYVWLSDFWALKAVVHELAHACQLEQWPEDQPDILGAYQHAMSQGLYHQVRDADGKALESGYAATNQLEYFAELSCAYFVGCDYFPFNRDQLKTYDPTGFAMIRKLWGVED